MRTPSRRSSFRSTLAAILVVLKVDSDGDLIWALEVDGGIGDDAATSMEIAPDGAPVVSGWVREAREPGGPQWSRAFLVKLVTDAPLEAGKFIRGDANGDHRVDMSDAVHMLVMLFLGSAALLCQDAADANDDGRIDVSDPIAVLGFLFLSSEPLPAPYPGPGRDLTSDGLDCAG